MVGMVFNRNVQNKSEETIRHWLWCWVDGDGEFNQVLEQEEVVSDNILMEML